MAGILDHQRHAVPQRRAGEGVEGEYGPGGTGWGVRTILELAAGFSPPR